MGDMLNNDARWYNSERLSRGENRPILSKLYQRMHNHSIKTVSTFLLRYSFSKDLKYYQLRVEQS